MITAPVTKAQMNEWKTLWQNHHAHMRPNRISGAQLDAYFRKKYHPKALNNAEFSEIMKLNVMEQPDYPDYSVNPLIMTYQTQNGVFVGIDLNTGYFHVENEDIAAMAAVWDDLFVARGLSAKDLQDFFLTAQYILLKEAAQE